MSDARNPSAASPEPVERLIDELTRLPGIGRRSAERVAFHLLKASTEQALRLSEAEIRALPWIDGEARVTVTPGRFAPSVSVTLPVTLAVGWPCAMRGSVTATLRSRHKMGSLNLIPMCLLFCYEGVVVSLRRWGTKAGSMSTMDIRSL